VEQRLKRVAVGRHGAVFGLLQVAMPSRAHAYTMEVDLVLIGVEVEEELVGVVDDLFDARVWRSTLLMTSTIGIRALSVLRAEARSAAAGPRRVDQRRRRRPWSAAFDLTAEVGVARGVGGVDRDLVGAVGGVVEHRRVLRGDRDALFAFEVARVHDPVSHFTAAVPSARLLSMASTSVVLP
jgi:hypothetical protein